MTVDLNDEGTAALARLLSDAINDNRSKAMTLAARLIAVLLISVAILTVIVAVNAYELLWAVLLFK